MGELVSFWCGTRQLRCADDVLVETRSKQARRTGMAGPLGEMFDHGEARTPTCPPSTSIQSGDKISRVDLIPVIHCRMRRDEHNGENRFREKARRDRLVWIRGSHIAEQTQN